MKFDLTVIVEIILTLVTTLVSTFLLPVIKQKLSAEKREHLQYWIETAVKAAEQLYGSKEGLRKKQYVVSFLLSKGVVVDADEVTAMIEKSVFELNQKITE